VSAVTILADQYCYLHRSDYRHTLIYAHTISRTLAICDISLGSLTLPSPEARGLMELIPLYIKKGSYL